MVVSKIWVWQVSKMKALHTHAYDIYISYNYIIYIPHTYLWQIYTVWWWFQGVGQEQNSVATSCRDGACDQSPSCRDAQKNLSVGGAKNLGDWWGCHQCVSPQKWVANSWWLLYGKVTRRPYFCWSNVVSKYQQINQNQKTLLETPLRACAFDWSFSFVSICKYL